MFRSCYSFLHQQNPFNGLPPMLENKNLSGERMLRLPIHRKILARASLLNFMMRNVFACRFLFQTEAKHNHQWLRNLFLPPVCIF